jgi:hypothetical protein
MAWVILAFFVVGGIAFWITMPDILIGPIWVGVSLILGVFYVVMFMRAEAAEEFKRTGTPGQAQILEVSQTGVYVNNQPRVTMKLRVEAPGVAPFEDTTTQTVPLVALGRLTAGAPLLVYLAPDNPRKYTIDWSGTPGFGVAPMNIANAQGGMVGLAGDAGAAAAIMKALSDHGIDASGTVDLTQLPAARAAVLHALETHGIDLAHQLAVHSPAIPIEDRGEPVERLQKLDQLRATNLISAEEYEAYRRRILEDL